VIDHVGLNVSDLGASRALFEAALAPLGFEQVIEHGAQVGFVSPDRYPDFWITQREPVTGDVRAASRAAVDAFHAAALAAGARDNGAPGIRAEYGPDYYGAYVLDLDGNNVEAMTYSE
jgi:catechol 2,3-dioxygenase-like lactoylglutathione lyase family enzyme